MDSAVTQHVPQVTHPNTNARKRTHLTASDGTCSNTEVAKKRKKKARMEQAQAPVIVRKRPSAPATAPSRARQCGIARAVYTAASPDSSQNSLDDMAIYDFSPADRPHAELQLKQLHINDLSQRLIQAQNTIAALRAEQQSTERKDLQTRQSMLLDLMAIEKKGEEQLRQVQRQKFYLQREHDTLQAQHTTQTAELEREKIRYEKAARESKMYRDEAEHGQALCHTLEEDLNELRRIENEDRRAREERRGLPPAYRSLDEEASLPPYKLHTDGGTFEVAVTKREIRSTFNKKVQATLSSAASLRKTATTEKDRQTADKMILSQTTTALADACRSLAYTLEYAGEGFTADYIQLKAPKQLSPDNVYRMDQARKTRIDRSYVASRLAKLILDLCWRTIAACELRPNSWALNLEEKARQALEWQGVDSALLDSIQQTIGTGEDEGEGQQKPSPHASLSPQARRQFELQYFETQILALRTRLVGLRIGMSGQFLGKARDWVGEHIETLRMLAAREAAATTSPTNATTGTNAATQTTAGSQTVATNNSTSNSNDNIRPDHDRTLERAVGNQVAAVQAFNNWPEFRTEPVLGGGPGDDPDPVGTALMEELFQAHINEYPDGMEFPADGGRERLVDLTG